MYGVFSRSDCFFVFLTSFLVALFLATLTGSARGEELRALQDFLDKRHCAPGPVDGQWGAQTAKALRRYSAHTAIAVERPIEPSDIERLATSDFKCSDIANINFFLPLDVTQALEVLPAATRAKLCRFYPASLEAIRTIEPKSRLKGLNSKMSNAADVPGFTELQEFASAVSQVAAAAYLHDDGELKAELLLALDRWARQKAYSKTRDCVNGPCPDAWRRRDGQDAAPRMDHSTSVDYVMSIAMAYVTVLSDFEPVLYAKEHRRIGRWLKGFDRKLRNRSGKRAYFGLRMGHQWSHMIMSLADGDSEGLRRRLGRLHKSINAIVLEDGSLKDRTTRGDRAMWYHHASLGELIGSLEMMRANGIKINADLERKTHKAVTLYLNALEDPRTIVKWASVSHNNGSDGRAQDFLLNDLLATDWGSSWIYAYIFRHPDHENSRRLRALFRPVSVLHGRDMGMGLNFGCLYRASDPVFREVEISGISAFEQAIEQYDVSFRDVDVWIHNAKDEGARYEDFKIRAGIADFKAFDMKSFRLGVLADYPDAARKPEALRLLRITIDSYRFKKVAGEAPDFSDCGPVAYNEQYGNVRLHFGPERVMNHCILSKLHPDDLRLWYSVYAQFGKITRNIRSAPQGHVERLETLYSQMIQ